jgi:hypothetical protein
MPKNSMLDSDFIEDGDFEEEGKGQNGEERWTPPEPTEVIRPETPGKTKGPDVAVEIGDDTPDEDRGKWVADDQRDGEPDIPEEDEVRGYAKGAQKRISQMTARIHAERRRADEIARENQEAVNLARRLMQENNQLKTFVENGEKVLMGEHRGRLQSLLEQAKVAYKEAHDAGDAQGMVVAQEQIASAVAKMERASAQQPMRLPKEDESIFNRPSIANGQQPQQPQVDPAAVKWAEKNTWFGRDDAMTGYALGYHKQLVERDGVMPDQPEYYSRLNQEMRRRFPDRFRSNGNGASPERRGAPPVGAVSRTGNGVARPRTVRITESQARLARRLGLTVEQYAQQIVAEQDQRDGRSFTHS